MPNKKKEVNVDNLIATLQRVKRDILRYTKEPIWSSNPHLFGITVLHEIDYTLMDLGMPDSDIIEDNNELSEIYPHIGTLYGLDDEEEV